MDTQTHATLQAHLDGIAAILIQEADPNDLQTWAGREKSVRALAQHHVLPEFRDLV